MKFHMGQEVLDTATGKIVKVLGRSEEYEGVVNIQYPAGDVMPVATYTLIPLEF